MHIARQSPQELVIVAGTRWISALCAVAALLTVFFVLTRHQPKALFLAAFFLLFTLIMHLRKTFTFDAMRSTVRWNGHKVFKFESGEIPFDDITDIGTESQTTSSGASNMDVLIYRLTIITRQATIPMSYAYNAQADRYSALRKQILDFVDSGSTRNLSSHRGPA